MKTLIMAAIRCSLMLVVPTVTYGISAQWDLDPISGDWNTAANWTPMSVPNGPSDIATFGLSNTTNVSVSADTEVNGIIFTPAATNPYSIGVNPGITLTLSGTGITNNSGVTQTFFLNGTGPGEEAGQMKFTNSATARNATIFMDFAGSVNFFNRSTAGSATISVPGGVGNSVGFFNNSTAGSALIDFSFAVSNVVTFSGNATAGTATVLGGELGIVGFGNHSSAGNATIIGGPGESAIEFFDFSTAGNAAIQGNGAEIDFFDSSRGGTAAIGLFESLDVFSSLNIVFHNAPGVTIGSLEGDETANVFLGNNNLTIGSNNLSTTFAGVIGDTGSLTKIGTGTLILSGTNTYTGDTNVRGGVLQVDGSINSNTFTRGRGTLAGTGTINGNVTNNGRTSPGDAPGTLTINGNYTQAQFAALMIQIAGTSAGDSSVLNVLGSANLSGILAPVLLNGFVPSVGDQFTFLNYASFSGAFRFNNSGIFNNGMERWTVTYQPTFAVLTATQNVPDQGSTFLLVALSLLGLMTRRRELVRRQF